MSITAVTNHLVFPTDNDVHGGASGAGRIGDEGTLAGLWGGASTRNCVVSGFSPIATGAGFAKAVPAGTAVIDGYVIKGVNSTTFTFTASQTVSLYLRLNYTSGKVTSVTLEDYTGTTIPDNSVLIAKVVTDGSGVTTYTDMRPQNRVVMGRSDVTPGPNYTVSGTTITFPTGYFFRAPYMVASAATTGYVTINASSATSATFTQTNHDGTGGSGAVSFIAFL